ncbi:MAG TPA: dodecin domain-containing protein [Methanosarcinales archaeon]|nr:dodecin domain-containing protein [Methanosarcinales archaeon]
MSVVKIIETVGESPDSWENVLKNAVEAAPNLPIFKSKNQIKEVNVKHIGVEVKDNKIVAFKCRVEIFLE